MKSRCLTLLFLLLALGAHAQVAISTSNLTSGTNGFGAFLTTDSSGKFQPVDAGTFMTRLGLASIYQPLDSDLTAIAALTTTSFGRSALTLSDAAAGRTLFGLTPASYLDDSVYSNSYTLATGTTDNSTALQAMLYAAALTNSGELIIQPSATTITDARLVSGSSTLISAQANFVASDVGIYVSGSSVYGGGISAGNNGVYITAVTSGSQATLSTPANATITNGRVTIYRRFSFGTTLQVPPGIAIRGQSLGSTEAPTPWKGHLMGTALCYTGTSDAMNVDITLGNRFDSFALLTTNTNSRDGIRAINTTGTSNSPPGTQGMAEGGSDLVLDHMWINGFYNDLNTRCVLNAQVNHSQLDGARNASCYSDWPMNLRLENTNLGGYGFPTGNQAGYGLYVTSGQGMVVWSGGQLDSCGGIFNAGQPLLLEGVFIENPQVSPIITGSGGGGASGITLNGCYFNGGITTGTVLVRSYGTNPIAMHQCHFPGGSYYLAQHTARADYYPADDALAYIQLDQQSEGPVQSINGDGTVRATYPMATINDNRIFAGTNHSTAIPLESGSATVSGTHFIISNQINGGMTLRAEAGAAASGYAALTWPIYQFYGGGVDGGNIDNSLSSYMFEWNVAVSPDSPRRYTFAIGGGLVSGSTAGLVSSESGLAVILSSSDVTLQTANGTTLTGTSAPITWGGGSTSYQNIKIQLALDLGVGMEVRIGQQRAGGDFFGAPQSFLTMPLGGSLPTSFPSTITVKTNVLSNPFANADCTIYGMTLFNKGF